jgi:thiol-disulfide isomerase/thioredoxin
MSKLIMFHGRECPHCRAMMPIVDRLIAEAGTAVDKQEVWHDEANADRMRSYKSVLSPKCGGQLRVPAFINIETNDALCGEVPYETLKAWASR